MRRGEGKGGDSGKRRLEKADCIKDTRTTYGNRIRLQRAQTLASASERWVMVLARALDIGTGSSSSHNNTSSKVWLHGSEKYAQTQHTFYTSIRDGWSMGSYYGGCGNGVEFLASFSAGQTDLLVVFECAVSLFSRFNFLFC